MNRFSIDNYQMRANDLKVKSNRRTDATAAARALGLSLLSPVVYSRGSTKRFSRHADSVSSNRTMVNVMLFLATALNVGVTESQRDTESSGFGRRPIGCSRPVVPLETAEFKSADQRVAAKGPCRSLPAGRASSFEQAIVMPPTGGPHDERSNRLSKSQH
jgi:hypothetical protein